MTCPSSPPRVATRPTARPRVSAVIGLGLAAAATAGCLSVPSGPAPMCHQTSDCDTSHGEVCEEGVCWGNPPVGPFAAVISPPSARRDLVPGEVAAVSIPDSGWTGDLALDKPAVLTGHVVQAGVTLAATVTVTRASQFHGGPGFKTFVNADAGADSFTLALPQLRPGDPAFTVTVIPAGGVQPAAPPAPAELAPPLRTELSASDLAKGQRTFELGGGALPTIRGTLTNGLGQGLSNYRVVALGRWDATTSPTEVSSVSFTNATGSYEIVIAEGLYGTIELVARPPRGTVAPTIHLANLDPSKSSIHNIGEPATLGAPIRLTIAVTGLDRSGTVSPVAGATVHVSGVASAAPASYTVDDEHITSDLGVVTLDVVDGAPLLESYRVAITPPAGSTLGVLFDQRPPTGGVPLRLPGRVALSGRVLDQRGKPLGNVAVTARPSLRFLWTLEAVPQGFVATIPAATGVTADDGGFVLWVDPSVAQVPGNYDLLIEPPAKAQAPSTVVKEIAIPQSSAVGEVDAVAVGDVTLPDAAYVHGRLVGPDGGTLEGAELKLYRVTSELSLCTQVAHAPASCPIPASLQGRNTSDSAGTFRIALPR